MTTLKERIEKRKQVFREKMLIKPTLVGMEFLIKEEWKTLFGGTCLWGVKEGGMLKKLVKTYTFPKVLESIREGVYEKGTVPSFYIYYSQAPTCIARAVIRKENEEKLKEMNNRQYTEETAPLSPFFQKILDKMKEKKKNGQ